MLTVRPTRLARGSGLGDLSDSLAWWSFNGNPRASRTVARPGWQVEAEPPFCPTFLSSGSTFVGQKRGAAVLPDVRVVREHGCRPERWSPPAIGRIARPGVSSAGSPEIGVCCTQNGRGRWENWTNTTNRPATPGQPGSDDGGARPAGGTASQATNGAGPSRRPGCWSRCASERWLAAARRAERQRPMEPPEIHTAERNRAHTRSTDRGDWGGEGCSSRRRSVDTGCLVAPTAGGSSVVRDAWGEAPAPMLFGAADGVPAPIRRNLLRKSLGAPGVVAVGCSPCPGPSSPRRIRTVTRRSRPCSLDFGIAGCPARCPPDRPPPPGARSADRAGDRCLGRMGNGAQRVVGPSRSRIGGSTPSRPTTPSWWNWKTHAPQERTPQGMRVRLPPRAPTVAIPSELTYERT